MLLIKFLLRCCTTLLVDLACYACTAGNYCPSGAAQETACNAGWYSAASATTCIECPPGSECPGLTAAVACSAGTYSLGAAQSCITCPTGENMVIWLVGSQARFTACQM